MKASETKCYRSVDFKNTTAWQVNGDSGWETIGDDLPKTIPVNGYLAVYLSNASSIKCENCMSSDADVYFDKLSIKFTRGNLKQETHYYPFGLPMAGIGSSAMGMTPNRQKYQSNEYITDAGLNWMSFGARQYDPQLGRFLSVDPMASEGGQDMLSPYHAMGNNPVSMTDPGGRIIQAGDAHLINFFYNLSPAITYNNYEPKLGVERDNFYVGQWINTNGDGEEALAEAYGQTAHNDYDATTGNNSDNKTKIAGNYGSGGDGSSGDGDGNPNSDMHLSSDGYTLLADYEGPPDGSKGFHDGKYWITDVGDGKMTIGLGYVITTKEEAKEYADGITPEKAYALMKGKVGGFENIVKGSINVALSQNEFDALVIMAYNHGSIYGNVRNAINTNKDCFILEHNWLMHDWARNSKGKNG